MAGRSTFRRVYELVALLALLHVLALGGVVTAAALSGGVTGEKVRRMVAIMRDEEVGETEEAPQQQEAEVVQTKVAEDASVETQVNEEIMRREAVRIKEELAQRLAQVNRALLLATMKREEFERRQADAADREQAVASERDQAGFSKLVEIFNGLSAKVAVEMLLDMDEPDDAARILMEMDARKAKKLVEAAKKANKLQKMQSVLERVRELSPVRSDELETG